METEQNHSRPVTEQRAPVNPPERLVFYPVAVVAILFVLTILMTLASAFGDPDAPLNRWLNRNAVILILAETGLLACVAVGSMTIDRMKTIRRQKQNQLASGGATPDSRLSVQEDVPDVG